MIKRYIDFRVVSERDPSNTDNFIFILEVRHKFLFFTYWNPICVDTDLNKLLRMYRSLKTKYGK